MASTWEPRAKCPCPKASLAGAGVRHWRVPRWTVQESTEKMLPKLGLGDNIHGQEQKVEERTSVWNSDYSRPKS